jgi:hypothetical protein
MPMLPVKIITNDYTVGNESYRRFPFSIKDKWGSHISFVNIDAEITGYQYHLSGAKYTSVSGRIMTSKNCRIIIHLMNRIKFVLKILRAKLSAGSCR